MTGGRLRGRVALVTGGASGIGKAICQRFAMEGAVVIVADVAVDSAKTLAASLTPHGHGVALDVADLVSIDRAVSHVVRTLGRIDILVNNAAIWDLGHTLDVSERSFDALFSVNVKGLFFVMQRVGQEMAKTKSGAIINMASQAGRRGEAVSPIYAATKAAVISLTQSAALDWVRFGVRVNAIAPGIVDTPMWETVDAKFAALENLPPGEKRRRVVAAVPIGRMAAPDEIAGAAVFLASDDATYVLGQTLNVDGGNFLS